jgi:hypothetical protein
MTLKEEKKYKDYFYIEESEDNWRIRRINTKYGYDDSLPNYKSEMEVLAFIDLISLPLIDASDNDIAEELRKRGFKGSVEKYEIGCNVTKKVKFILTILLLVFLQNISAMIKIEPELKDTLYSITANQMRTTAKIFVEHKYLKQENSLLMHQLAINKDLVSTLESKSGTMQNQITDLNSVILGKGSQITEYQRLNDEIRKQSRKNVIKYTAIGTAAGIVVGIIIKSI